MSDKNFELKNPATGLTTSLPVRTGTIGPEVLDIANITQGPRRLHFPIRRSA